MLNLGFLVGINQMRQQIKDLPINDEISDLIRFLKIKLLRFAVMFKIIVTVSKKLRHLCRFRHPLNKASLADYLVLGTLEQILAQF